MLRLVKTECRLVCEGPKTGPTPQKMVPWRRPRNPIHASPRPLTRDDKYQQNDETPPPTYYSFSHTCARAAPPGAPQGVSLSFQGQEKVLVTGPWYSQTEPYQILFGGTPVATTLVQSGVLRCFAPGKSFPIKKSHHGFCFCCLINHSFKSLASFCQSPNHRRLQLSMSQLW